MRNAETLGRYNVAGLPDIIGELGSDWNTWSNESLIWPSGTPGAFQKAAKEGNNVSAVEAPKLVAGRNYIQFTAHLSNAIFGATDTVMPASADIAVGIYLGRPTEI